MNKHRAVLPLIAATLAFSLATAPAFAVKPEKMTCEDFLVLDEEVQPLVVYWLHGNTDDVDEIDLDEYMRPVAYIITECTKDKKATVWEKLKKYITPSKVDETGEDK